MSYNLPNPSLVGILLAVSTHNGPHFIYHYPPELSQQTLSTKTEVDSDDDFDAEDYEQEAPNSTGVGSSWDLTHPDYYLGTKLDIFTFLNARDDYRSKNQDRLPELSSTSSLKKVPSNLGPQVKTRVLGFEPEHLSEMLCPPRDMCNRRFEVMLEKVVFLGFPVHIGNNGSWRTRPPKNKKTTVKSDAGDDALNDSDPDAEGSSSDGAMSMFHLVFVMNPPDIERNYRIDEIFYCVISKISLVLRYEQEKHDYVWNQVRLMSKLKEEWRTASPQQGSLSDHLLAGSSLCKMMADCYDAVSSSNIANLNINNKLRSFQIPVKLEFHSLPELTVPYVPGSYLSSTTNWLSSTGLVNVGETTRYRTNSLMNLLLGGRNNIDGNADDDDDLEGEEGHSNTNDVIHLALLLSDDPELIIKDIKASPNSAIARFVRMIRPTESLLKISHKLKQQSGGKYHLNVSEIKSFASHLIYWRRARVIPPLNTRAVYIVSPMAPITTNFHADIVKFKAEFPTVPSLPQFLKLLSTRSKKTRLFASIIPSKDHKDMYIDALAWLIRSGYVTQLHTFIWLKVPRKVKMKVEEELEEELGKAPKRNKDSEYKDTPSTDNKVNALVDNSSKQNDTTKKQDPAVKKINEDIDQLQKNLAMSSVTPNIVLEEDDDTILVDPGRASSLERRWINKIIHDECNLRPELTAIFYKLLKYMNGKNSLELLLLRENVSRTELRKLLVAIEDHIISVRHW